MKISMEVLPPHLMSKLLEYKAQIKRSDFKDPRGKIMITLPLEEFGEVIQISELNMALKLVNIIRPMLNEEQQRLLNAIDIDTILED